MQNFGHLRSGCVQPDIALACQPAGHEPVYPAYIENYSPDYFPRLIFDSADLLTGWKKFTK